MTTQEHVLALVVQDRIVHLASQCHWFRKILPSIAPSLKPAYASMFEEWRQELRLLNGLRRKARRIAREVERTALIDQGVEAYEESFAYRLGEAVRLEDMGVGR